MYLHSSGIVAWTWSLLHQFIAPKPKSAVCCMHSLNQRDIVVEQTSYNAPMASKLFPSFRTMKTAASLSRFLTLLGSLIFSWVPSYMRLNVFLSIPNKAKEKKMFKVHIFWEGNKFLRNLHSRFVLCSNSQIYGRDFAKFLSPSQNIWTLQPK